ncbi:hypothetical protein WT77_30355 [Burkholderia stagnalis]|nr:hypothetical protein WT18_01515 [Burkholderia stagnalis]KVP07854.1 hypothetical protein WT20_23635 [Burkholderia stagnalis]KVW89815.1 hypothetical protein WT30_28275 [Burkholderia stagnalis]KWH67016.1 hypothetical protein WT66_32445 [Burkholderia stagnalis]KWK16540.1 hypothetical protein WT77_30355 [Burkholderia stagnalis]
MRGSCSGCSRFQRSAAIEPFEGFLRIDVGQRERCGVSRSIRLRGAMIVALRCETERSPTGGRMIAIAIA